MDNKTFVQNIVAEKWNQPNNRLWQDSDERAWAEPLVGFCRGDDPLFETYKAVVGSFHWTPREAFSMAFPDIPAEPSELAVIVWILPQTTESKRDNSRETRYPAERWARSRYYGEMFNAEMKRDVASALTGKGFPAIAPMLIPEFTTMSSGTRDIASTWSERHAAYAAGLGTFGLSDGLITPKGKAVRIGSVIAKIEVSSANRPYEDHHAYCLHFGEGTCGECIGRCPAGAISRDGHDKKICESYLAKVTGPFVNDMYGFPGYGCGLCQAGVPCESGIPTRSSI